MSWEAFDTDLEEVFLATHHGSTDVSFFFPLASYRRERGPRRFCSEDSRVPKSRSSFRMSWSWLPVERGLEQRAKGPASCRASDLLCGLCSQCPSEPPVLV